MNEITVRPMTPEDWSAVAKIYLEGIATEHATFQTDCPPYTEEAGYWTLQSTVLQDNAASKGLHLKCGFRLVGRRERIARDCHGRWLDTFLMERRCKDDEPSGYRKL